VRGLCTILVAWAAIVVMAVGGCDGATEGPTGTLQFALGGPVADVTGLYYEIDCGGALYTQYVDLEAQGLPPHIDPDLAGSSFGDYFLTVPEGPCEVTVTPMLAPEVPSELCGPVSESVNITAGLTTEVLLVISCASNDGGGLDVVTVLNEAPTITELVVDPGLSVPPCITVHVDVLVMDPEGDPLSFTYSVLGPPGPYSLTPNGASVAFYSGVEGTWTILVEVSDGYGTTEASVNIAVTGSGICE
jgi:hypothetical protein